MAGIADLGNNVGWVYKTLADGNTIVSVERNTIEGVKSMQQMGVTNAPIIAARSAYSLVGVVNAGAGTGQITNVTINGVNQIGGPITISGTSTAALAEQIVDAINIYTAPGFKFTASFVGPIGASNFLYIFSQPQDGDAVNGLTVTISSTDPGVQIFPQIFINGSSNIGIYDNTFGYRFYLNSDVAAVPTSKGVKAVEITEFITIRGSQSGIYTLNAQVFNDRLSGIARACDTIQVILDTQFGPTDVLAWIQPNNFAEGDTLRIRGNDPGRVVTLQDANATTSSIPTPNIYLTDQAPFSLTSLNSITLQYRVDPLLGPIWIETGRSLANNPIVTTLVQFVTDCSIAVLKPGQTYFITDLGGGAYVDAISTSEYNSSAVWIRKIPTSYTACWRPNMATPVIGTNYRYNQLVYVSVTGAVGTAPDVDTVNWTLVPTTNIGLYASRYHSIVLDNQAINLLTWPVIEEKDQFGNTVIQTRANFLSLGRNAYTLFCWSTDGFSYYGNYVNNSIFETANSDKPVYGNQVTGNTEFYNNVLDSTAVFSNNIINNSQIYNNYFQVFAQNNLYTALIINNGTASFVAPQINQNFITGGYLINNTCSSTIASIISNTINTAGAIQNNNLGNNGKIRYNYLDTVCFIQNCNFSSPASFDIDECKLYSGSILEYINNPASGTFIKRCVLTSSEIYRDASAGVSLFDLNNSLFTNTIIREWPDGGCTESSFTNCNFGIGVPLSATFQNCNISNWVPLVPYTNASSLLNANIIVGVFSNYTASLDLDDPTIYSANVLTIPNYASIASEFTFTSLLATKTIDEVVDLPNFPEVKFYNATFGSCTITVNKVSPGAWSGNLILGAANFTLNGHATGVSDFMTMAKYAGSANMITSGVNFV